MKPGGILSGHDYVNGDLPQGEFYVKAAVDEFFGDLVATVDRDEVGGERLDLDRRCAGGRRTGPGCPAIHPSAAA